MRKILSLFLAVLMTISMFAGLAITSNAAGPPEEKVPEAITTSYYSYDNGTLTITDSEYAVGWVEDIQKFAETTTCIRFEGNVTIVCDFNVYCGWEKIQQVEFAEGVVDIRWNAFAGNHDLKSVVLPVSIQKIDAGAFYDTGLTEITIKSKACEILSGEDIDEENFGKALGTPGVTTVYAPVGSTAEAYAKEFGYTFVAKEFDYNCEEQGHAFGEGALVNAGSCTEGATFLYTCVYCGFTKTRTTEALGHSWSEEEKECPCAVYGTAVYKTCTICGAEEIEYCGGETHAWDDGAVVVEPTKESMGEMQYTCTVCGATKSEAVPEIDHQHEYEQQVVPATCVEGGYTIFTCRCGDSYIEDQTAPLGHEFVNGACTRCGEPFDDDMPFVDVENGKWFYDAVKYVFEHEIFSGTSATTFAPTTEMTRAMIVQVLYNLEGTPEVEGETTFKDLKENAWYTNAVIWASQNGLVAGYSEDEFGPDDPITREQMAMILMRYAQFKNYVTDQTVEIDDFPDAEDVSKWAKDGIVWAIANGFISGKQTGEKIIIDPLGNATRAEVASIMMRFNEFEWEELVEEDATEETVIEETITEETVTEPTDPEIQETEPFYTEANVG